jgi:5-methylcytosine-specific restriction endonuclease McrA
MDKETRRELRELGLLPPSRAGDPRNTARWRRITAAARRAGGTCGLCGLPIAPGITNPNHPGALQVDHVVPLAQGGDPFDPTNLRVAHRLCNLKRGAGRQSPKTEDGRSSSW